MAAVQDLKPLLDLEALCFDPARRDPPSTLRRSLTNPRHEVWMLDGPEGRAHAALFLRHLRKALRIYSLATDPSLRGQGWGNVLLEWAISRARFHNEPLLTLEADASNADLVAWYERHSFERVLLLPSYYAPGRDAWRLVRRIDPSRAS